MFVEGVRKGDGISLGYRNHSFPLNISMKYEVIFSTGTRGLTMELFLRALCSVGFYSWKGLVLLGDGHSYCVEDAFTVFRETHNNIVSQSPLTSHQHLCSVFSEQGFPKSCH